ncbi:hypothetical protein R3W88_029677 [Solanum pinnatisectum]|uniref:Uncharacterized protein n=1 Tax=Solanum pinnatisectum TaxID=50273 RepID=A0AAV9K687_9SOLN|nr:hypothetical protein R3W88_029677 [Solanum pinnatisectum]
MESLISFLLHDIKKQKPHPNNFRCLSDTSNRSYYMLIRADSIEGSSHHRTRSEFQLLVTIDFLDLPQPRRFNNRATSLFPLVSNQNASVLTATNNLQGTTIVDNLRHRKF